MHNLIYHLNIFFIETFQCWKECARNNNLTADVLVSYILHYGFISSVRISGASISQQRGCELINP